MVKHLKSATMMNSIDNTEKAIQRFPPVWQDRIREHIGGLQHVGVSYIFNGVGGGIGVDIGIDIDAHMSLVDLKTYRDNNFVVVNDFPVVLYSDGEYTFGHDSRQGDLPTSIIHDDTTYRSRSLVHRVLGPATEYDSKISIWKRRGFMYRKKYTADNSIYSQRATYFDSHMTEIS